MNRTVPCSLLLISVLSLGLVSAQLVEHEINLLGKRVDDALEELRSLPKNGDKPAGPSTTKVQDVQPVDPPKRTAGYFKLSGTTDSHMFYFFFESRLQSETAPLILWTNGGPGCSSEMAVFKEQGPYIINDDLTLSLREFGWDATNNMIFVDQPIGTGFSYSSSSGDSRYSSQDGVGKDVTAFMMAFYEKHPEMAGRDFYVTGESYAGHYVPGIAYQIQESNKAGKGLHIPLAGIAIGNGLTNPRIQYAAYPDFALDKGIISKSKHDKIVSNFGYCSMMISLCETVSFVCPLARIICENSQFRSVLNANPGMNYYDIRLPCEGEMCYDFSILGRYLNQESVQKQLNVNKYWVECNKVVYFGMLDDWMVNYEDDVSGLLADGVRVLIYAGNQDFICNVLGNRRWVDTLEWAGAEEWAKASDFDWTVSGEYAGKVKEAKGKELVFVEVDNAGHMVPMDKPEQALDMINRFVNKESFGGMEPTSVLPQTKKSSVKMERAMTT